LKDKALFVLKRPFSTNICPFSTVRWVKYRIYL